MSMNFLNTDYYNRYFGQILFYVLYSSVMNITVYNVRASFVIEYSLYIRNESINEQKRELL